MMGSKVVSTKLSEEEYGKLVGLCSASGYTVSKLLKRAILSRMSEDLENQVRSTQKPVAEIKHAVEQKPQVSRRPKIKQNARSDEKFLYY